MRRRDDSSQPEATLSALDGPEPLGEPLLAVTVINRSCLAQADALFSSLRRVHPGAATFALLVDEWPRGAPPPSNFTVELLEPEAAPQARHRLFAHNRFQRVVTWKSEALSRAVKRFPESERVLFLDADTWVLGSLEPFVGLLDSSNIVLSPHLVAPLPARGFEQQLLRVGTYNGGLLGLRAKTSAPFLQWWESRIRTDCIHSFRQGLFQEQKWLDLIPSLFDRVQVCRHPGINTAYWRLSSMGSPPHTSGSEELNFDAESCRLFHFSGWRPDSPEQLSVHSGGVVTPTADSPLGRLLSSYHEAVESSPYRHLVGQPSVYDRYYDGRPISEWDSLLYRHYWSRRWPTHADPYSGLPAAPALSALGRIVETAIRIVPGLGPLDSVPALPRVLERLALSRQSPN